MRSISISRPTPAFVLAFIALIVALGGTSYAAVKISGKSLQKQSVPGNRLVLDGLGGKQVNEAKLGIVPLAANAQLADSAKLATEADHAKAADKATQADNATQADKALQADKATLADKATKADDADELGGRGPSSYLRSTRIVRSVLVQNVANGAGVEETATCQGDERLISGGAAFYIVNTTTTVGSATLSTNIPLTNGIGIINGWRGEGKNTSGVIRDFRVFAVCAPA